VPEPVEILKLLADATRLRLLHLLAQEELAVAELQEILGMGQSRISNHLALLRQHGLATDRREGKRSFYIHTRPAGPLGELVAASLAASAGDPEVQTDQQALERIVNRRRAATEQYFNEIAGRLGKRYCPGRSWEGIGHALLHLTPAVEIADLGSGEGLISQLLARRARHVHCVDNSPRMVEVGQELAAEQGIDNLTFHLGDIEAVPLPDASVDVALLSQALHHAEHPPKALAEAFRILRPGGQLLLLDLKEHTFEKARELYQDRWLGFSPNDLYQWFKDAGFTQVSAEVVAREEVEPFFETLLACGVKG